MARKDERKLFLFGKYSLALLLPKKWLRELGANRGDPVGMELDRKRKRLVLRFGTKAMPINPNIDKIIDSSDEKSKNGVLQPIPEL